jgi:SAM-dependent methyltransferase
VRKYASEVPPGSVLDLACGSGRHGRLFLERGHPVTFVDRDLSGTADLEGIAGVERIGADLEGAPWPLGERRYAGVVVVNYLWRPLLPALIAAIAQGGVLVYETFAAGQERYGSPRRREFQLNPGELLGAVRGTLEVRAYTHGDDGAAVKQRIWAVRVG